MYHCISSDTWIENEETYFLALVGGDKKEQDNTKKQTSMQEEGKSVAFE